MQVFDNEYVVAFDVDDTLVMWEYNFDETSNELTSFIDPYDNAMVFLRPNLRHIGLLKKYKKRGMCVMVWSAGGVKWAETVIKTLALEDYVDLVITKPSKYVDDLNASEILGQRVYLK